jgi:serine/threonine-protein kinase CTR1
MTLSLTDQKTDAKLAVKRVYEGERFFREVNIFASLRHPCLIPFVGWSKKEEEKRKLLIGMKYASNGSIEDALNLARRGDPPEFWTHENISCMIVGIVLGMIYLHSQDIIHRDLKPANLLIDETFRVQLCDFGTALPEICETTMAAGTVAYIAPEVRNGAHPTKAFDVFAFGLILYELLVGESVFQKDINPILLAELHRKHFRPEIPNFVPRAMRDLIEKCWSDDPSLRPTFPEIYDRLDLARFRFFDDVVPKVVLDYIKEVRNQEGQ